MSVYDISHSPGFTDYQSDTLYIVYNATVLCAGLQTARPTTIYCVAKQKLTLKEGFDIS